MKKLLAFTAVALAISLTPAMAEGHGDKPHGGKMFEKHDTNGDGSISKAEFLSHAEERFSKMDADGSGSVSKEEAKAGHEAMKEKMKEMRKERKAKRDVAPEASDE